MIYLYETKKKHSVLCKYLMVHVRNPNLKPRFIVSDNFSKVIDVLVNRQQYIDGTLSGNYLPNEWDHLNKRLEQYERVGKWNSISEMRAEYPEYFI